MSTRTRQGRCRILTSILILLLGPLIVVAQQGAVQNVHDPCIIKEKDTYYVYATGPGIAVRKSKDLIEWVSVGRVFDKTPDWASKAVPGNKGSLWAPDISFFNGKYHLYYSVSTFGSRRSCIGLATNKTLDLSCGEYKWIDAGVVVSSTPQDDWNAIDPNIVLDENGRPWLSFGSFWGGLKMVKIDPDTGKPKEKTVYSIAARPVEKAIEAPFIVRKNGYYYLFASWDRCCRGVKSDYKIVVGRSKSVTGPYVDRAGIDMARGGGTLLLAGYDNIKGPGHNALLMEGEKDWLIHHYYDAYRNGIATLQIRPLLWADDGWPLAGEPTSKAEPEPKGMDKRDVAGVWEFSVNFGPTERLALNADGKMGQGLGSWEVQGSTLTLCWLDRAAAGDARIDRCFLSADGRWFVGRNEQGAVVRGKRTNDK